MASVASTLSWNTFLSRTSVSSLSCAVFSEQQGHAVHGLEDIIRAVRALRLKHFSYKDINREELLGEGETYRVERCVVQGLVYAIKYLKTNFPTTRGGAGRAPPAAAGGGGGAAANTDAGNGADNGANNFHRRLRSVILEMQILRHSPVRAHPNFPDLIGYGWNTVGAQQIIPYILLEYAPQGNLRDYLRSQPVDSWLPRDIEILVGDVAAALTALHTCGIVHGDVKLDNVLVTPSWDRPCKTLVKLTDFGHALILDDKSRKNDDGPMRYSGTLMYNAPEVKLQDIFPIDRADLPKCDTWAFGLLIWEACIGGEEYRSYLARHHPEGTSVNDGDLFDKIKPAEMLKYAMRSVPGPKLGPALLIRASLSKTIQEDPAKRISDLQKIPIMTKWQASGPRGLEADLALHLDSPSPTYEMFRSESGREIPWTHEKQIFNGLRQTHTGRLAKDIANFIWQIALCYHVGFGTARSAETAYQYAQKAKGEGHPVAKIFADVLDPNRMPPMMPLASTTAQAPSTVEETPATDGSTKDDRVEATAVSAVEQVTNCVGADRATSYAARVATLMRATASSQAQQSRSGLSFSAALPEMPPLVKACYNGSASEALALLRLGENPNSSTADGCTAFHWFWMFQETSTLAELAAAFRTAASKGPAPARRLQVDGAFYAVRHVHDQWPLQLAGTPLALHISVNDLEGVRTLLSLGADPLARVHPEGKYQADDPRSGWTAVHLAAKYHCSEILLELLDAVGPEQCRDLPAPPLACVLSFSATLERLAMHGARHTQQLDATIAAIRGPAAQPLGAVAAHGMTALMQAIDFQDHDVVESLLRAEPALSSTRLCSPRDERLFNMPIHFAAQIAARRDVPEALLVPQLIDQYSGSLGPKKEPPRDDLGRTPLHLAVTGASSRVAEWILSRREGLLHVEDLLGRIPLHCCASVACCELLLERGSQINHTDKHGMSALHRYSLLGEPELVACLLKRQPKLDLKNNRFGTPLHCAIISGSLDVVLALLDAGSPVDAQDHKGNAPVHVAARLDRHVILRTLMQRGADIALKNRNNRNAQQIAAAVGAHGNIGALRVLQSGREAAAFKRMVDHNREQHGYVMVNTGTGGVFPARPLGAGPPDFDWEPDEDANVLSIPQLDDHSDAVGSEFGGFGGGSVTTRETNDWGDWSDLGDDQTEETFDDRDERMGRLVKTVEDMSDVYGPEHILAPGNNRVKLETMDLVNVFFEDAIWQPKNSAILVDVMAETARDLGRALQHSYVSMKYSMRTLDHATTPLDDIAKWLKTHDSAMSSGGLESLAEALKINSEETRDGDDAVSLSQWSMSSSLEFDMETAREGVAGAETGQTEEDKKTKHPTKEKADVAKAERKRPKGNETKQETKMQIDMTKESTEQDEQNDVEPEPGEFLRSAYAGARGADHVATVVLANKPNWVLPGRTREDLVDMIMWEMARSPPLYRPNSRLDHYTGVAITWPETKWASDNGPKTYKLFPELYRERGSERYRRWVQLREKVAASSNKMNTAQESEGSELASWRSARDPMVARNMNASVSWY